MTSTFTVISPVDGTPLLSRNYATPEEIDRVMERSLAAFHDWKRVPLEERIRLALKFVDCFVAKKDDIAREITMQMGRPIRFAAKEVKGFEDRARYVAAIAPQALADVVPQEAVGAPAPAKRYIRREPLGPVLVLAAWNYPYLVSVNAVVPALLAGNTVVLKQSPQTPLCAERFAEAFQEAGLPKDVFQYIHMSHEDVPRAVKHPATAYVNYTGSIEGGLAVQLAAVNRLIGVGLELGGKDAAYVRKDAVIDHAVEQLVDGAFFNSGQSCCGVERIYVAEEIYECFVDKFVALTKKYKLGNPLDEEVTLGPMVRAANANRARIHVQEALAQGAQALIDEKLSPESKEGTAYMAPQVLVNVNHQMRVMREETFGPVVGIMKVSSDAEAVSLINDTEYGLTASIWTQDLEVAEQLGDLLDVGTVFTNRCDYVDPALAWTGTKQSGRGCTLSKFGFDALTRPKSFNLNATPRS